MKQILINQIPHLVDERFEDFNFIKKQSTNIDVIGYDPNVEGDTTEVVVQFMNGSAYTYQDVPKPIVLGVMTCDSIGKYYRSEITGKYTGIKIIGQAVTLIKNGEEHTNNTAG